MGRKNGLLIVGMIFVIAGILGFAIPVFETQETEEVARIGDLTLQSTEDTQHRIPSILSGGILFLGMVLVGTSFYQKR